MVAGCAASSPGSRRDSSVPRRRRNGTRPPCRPARVRELLDAPQLVAERAVVRDHAAAVHPAGDDCPRHCRSRRSARGAARAASSATAAAAPRVPRSAPWMRLDDPSRRLGGVLAKDRDARSPPLRRRPLRGRARRRRGRHSDRRPRRSPPRRRTRSSPCFGTETAPVSNRLARRRPTGIRRDLGKQRRTRDRRVDVERRRQTPDRAEAVPRRAGARETVAQAFAQVRVCRDRGRARRSRGRCSCR